MEAQPSPGARRALALLALVYTFNFLDRTLIYILFGPIKAELGLGETELALLGSTSFVLFYTALGVPFGRLADRVHRVRMVAAGLLLWSLASAATAVMDSFAGIFACRVLVGVGEATLGPAALSIIADLFPPSGRARASALFGAGVPVGAAVAMFGGGAIAASHGWRSAFWVLGLPGIVLAAALVLLVREPARGARDQAPAAASAGPGGQAEPPAPRRSTVAAGTSARALAGRMLRDPSTRCLLFGYALFAVAANAVAMWAPSLLVARHGQDLRTVGTALGAATLVGGLAGSALGGTLADRMRRRGEGGRVRFAAAAALCCAAAWLALLGAPSFAWAVGALVLLCAGALVWLGPALADLAELVPPGERGSAVGVYYLVVNLVGYGVAPPLLGLLAEHAPGDQAARLGTALLACPAVCCIAAFALHRGALHRERLLPYRRLRLDAAAASTSNGGNTPVAQRQEFEASSASSRASLATSAASSALGGS